MNPRSETAQFSRSFYVLTLAQFLSALADNALLLLCIAILVEQGQPAWWIPLIKASFTVSYVVAAPWVGVLADRWAKPGVMRVANCIKLLGTLGVVMALPVPLGYALIGLGAALYAPAKYGWMTEVVPASDLVRANGWMEVGTVGAAILGVALGGLLIGAWAVQPDWLAAATRWMALESAHLPGMLLMLALYACPIMLTFWVRDSKVCYAEQSLKVGDTFALFVRDQWRLISDGPAQVSLAVTTLFWGLGAVIQLLALQWAQEQLHISLDQAAYLQACTGLGVIAGAWLAGRYVQLAKATQVLGVGVLLGAMIPVMNWIVTLPAAVGMMLVVGAMSGFFVVPMNALLQHRGVQLLTAGRSIAVQNFNENASILVQTGLYALLIFAEFSLAFMLNLFGLLTTSLMVLVLWQHRRLAALHPR